MQNLDYGVIGNGKTAALVSRTGAIEWLCMPSFDSPALFSAILDREKGGEFSIATDPGYRISQKYLPHTNILATIFESSEGTFEVLDFMPRYHTTKMGYYTPPEIYRFIRRIGGRPRFRVRYRPRMNYAREEAVHRIRPESIRTSSESNARDHMYLYSSLDFEGILTEREFILEKDEFLLLSYYQKIISVDLRRVYLEYQRTKVYWMNWSNRSKKYRQYDDLIGRSLLTLKLLTVEDTGAVVAAVTTSLPETVGETRNWDYRFCWIRDASMSIDALLRMGHRAGAEKYMGFIKNILRSKSDSFQIMYGINGERTLTEEILPHYAGFAGSRPVRIGNAAYDQRQNDIYGYLMEVIHRYYLSFPGTLDEIEQMWEIVKNIAYTVRKQWRDPDHSIWEFRHITGHFVFSKAMCWVALDRAAAIADQLGKTTHRDKWRTEAESIRQDIFANGWNDRIGSFTQEYGGTDADSSLLLMEYYGFIEAGDPRFAGTVRYLKQELFRDGLMYRYKREDDFGKPSSAFLICTFWLIRALCHTDRVEEAREIFERVAGYGNHLGLFSEDLDFATKRQLGNFPQAYSHLALIDTAMLFTEEVPASVFIRP